ncbi:MAG: hypothetical protein CL823_04500 [Crocinitomicaceae bacterium]|nr:hypothetical protein [Crocinitomicaceae bacterium]|tara:strand:+ start:321 stop:1055 length:735 start_codon:yes stop_codon:yes gene_type:complete
MIRKILSTLFCLIFIGGITTVVVLSYDEDDQTKITTINIKIADEENSLFINEARIRYHLDENGPLIGQYVKDLNISELHDYISEIPFVRKANVYVSLRGAINIELTQKQPQARVHPPNGKDYYIDEFGETMPLDNVHSERVPVIHARKLDEAKLGVEFLNEVEGDRFWTSLIDQIIIEPSGDITILPRLGAPVFIGLNQDVEEQKKNLITFYREQVKSGNLKKYRKIDLSYQDQVIATRYAHLN